MRRFNSLSSLKHFGLLAFLVFAALLAEAQTIERNFHLQVNDTLGKHIPYCGVKVECISNDEENSIILEQYSDSLGIIHQTISIPKNSSALKIYLQKIGFVSKSWHVDNPNSDSLIFKVNLISSPNMLEQITVTENLVDYDGEKHTHYLSQDNKKRFKHVIDALNVIPDLVVENRNGYRIYRPDGEALLILVNGVEMTAEDLLSIKSSNIKKIENYTQPTSQFLTDKPISAINIITELPVSGYVAHLDLENSVNRVYGNDIATLNLHRGKSQFKLSLKGRYRDYFHYQKSEFLKYKTVDSVIVRQKRPFDSDQVFRTGYIQTNYKYQNENKFIFNVDLWRLGYKLETDLLQQVVNQNTRKRFSRSEIRKHHTTGGGFDLRKSMGKVNARLMGRFRKSTSDLNTIVSEGESNPIESMINNDGENTLYKILTSTSIKLSKKNHLNLSFTVQQSEGKRTINLNSSKANNLLFTYSTNYSRKISDFISVSAYAQYGNRRYQPNEGNDFIYYKTARFFPRLTIRQKNKNIFTFWLDIENKNPAFIQQFRGETLKDFRFTTSGNEALKKYTVSQTTLNYHIQSLKNFYIKTTLSARYSEGMIFTTIGQKENSLVETYSNYDRYYQYYFSTFIRYYPWKDKRLAISGYVKIEQVKARNKNINLQTNPISAYIYATYNSTHWGINAYANVYRKQFRGIYAFNGEEVPYIEIKRKFKKFNLGVGWKYPVNAINQQKTYSLIDSNFEYNTESRNNDLNNVVYIKAQLTFAGGRKIKNPIKAKPPNENASGLY